MSLPVRVAIVLAAALLLTGCTPEAPEPTTTPVAEVAETPTPTPTPTAEEPETVDPADFLLDGTPGAFDADGFWKGHYGFYTDDTKAVRCDVWVFSGDSGAATCAVTPGNEGKVTYALPATDCQASDGNNVDGYSVGINFKVFATGYAGFSGCGAGASDFAGTTKVLHDNQTLVVTHDNEQFSCTVAAGVASCADAGTGASIRFGLAVADFAG
ncbi:hypothetical protein BH11ACT5_BH11ACT5_18210 [soil metagenome]